MGPTLFPFSALVGQEALQTALLVNTVDPAIGGVLIRGQKGTGKSTAARALAALLPTIEVVADCPYHCPPGQPDGMHRGCRTRHDGGETLPRTERPTPFVDLPLSTTEDRLVGTLDLQRTLASGERHFEPGLLAAANRGILYVDEVNLLPDHLVDLLLDAAASGINRVEREGLCFEHPARFLLVGTMNPEEGELRPQFLDRFGLCVTVGSLQDPSLRRAVIERRLAFDSDPSSAARFAAEDRQIAAQIAQARQRLDRVELPSACLDLAVKLATDAGVQGHRADLGLIRTARALAAFCERDAITTADLVEAAHLVLPHRLPETTGAPLETSAVRIADLLAEHDLQLDSPLVPGAEANEEPLFLVDNMDFPGSAAAGSMLFTYLKKKSMTASSPSTTPST